MALRFLRILMFGAVLALAPAIAMAQGAATVAGSEQQNFGRLIFTMPSAQPTRARVSNGVLVVSFSEPVTLSAERIVREMPNYVSVARVDPDGRGIRFALTRNFRANHMEAAEKVFVDLIPDNWQGMMPGLPKEVVDDLARRTRIAEAAARSAQRQREQAQTREIEVRAATLPTLSRLVFDIPPMVDVDRRFADGKLDIVVNAPMRVNAARLRTLLPGGVRLETADSAGGLLKIRLAVPSNLVANSFREEDGFILDFTDKDRPTATAETARVVELPPVAPTASAPAAVPAAARPPAAPAPAPVTPAVAPAPPASVPARPEQVETAPEKPALPVAVRITTAPLGDGARIDFAFPRRTPAAAFLDRGELVMVFETVDTIDPAELSRVAATSLTGVTVAREGRATVVRAQLKREALPRFGADGLRWTLTTGDRAVQAAQTLAVQRGADQGGQTAVTVALPEVSGVHWVTVADEVSVAVATAHAPASALPKPHRFVEFQLEQTLHGVVVRPVADDVSVRAGVGEVLISRGSGLSVSVARAAPVPGEGAKIAEPVVERAAWDEMRLGATRQRMDELFRAASAAPRSERTAARLKLAQFLLANDLAAEALGPLAVTFADDPLMRNDRRAHLLRAIAQIAMRRTKEAEATLSQPALKDDAEAMLWRAVNDGHAGRFARALGAFRSSGAVIDGYPEVLQARIREQVVRSAIAMRDVAVAERELAILAQLSPTYIARDRVALLRAELDEVNGRPEAALAGYRALFDSSIRPVAAWAQLKGIQLADRENDPSITAEERLARLETISLTWRGDELEIEAIGELGAIYAGQQRWREAFGVARQANRAFPDHPITRKLHDETARQFADLFTTGKGDQLNRIEALALFYDFKEFMPIGARGDEIIRRLADRLVELDLLDQAAEMLQHQIDNRLNGAARATVATRLAMVRLMNRNPAEAMRALTSTRLAELPGDVKRARQLLEAKALSDLSRTDLALEILEAERGPEVERLKADIVWTARRWREAGEAHERILGEAWRAAEPLSDLQRADVMRAAVAYVMAGETLSLDRLRTKFAGRMSETPDARTFAFVTGSNRASPNDIRELARNVANADTLMEFMGEYRKRYPDLATSLRRRTQPAPAETSTDAQAAPPDAAGRPG